MRAFRAKISRKRASSPASSSESHASADRRLDAESLAENIKGATNIRDLNTSTTRDITAKDSVLARPKGTQPKASIDTCVVPDVPLEIEYLSGASRSSSDEYSLSVFAVASQSPRLPCTPRTERALQCLKNAVQTFEHQYAIRKLNAPADSTEWDDEMITTALRQATQGTVFEASKAFGKAIATTVAKGVNTVEEKTKRRTISGFVGKLFPLLKVLISVGEAAAQV